MVTYSQQSPEILVNGLSSANLHFKASRPHRPCQLSIPDEVAEHFLITDIKVGRYSQMIGASCLPASAFAASARAEEIYCDWCREGEYVTVSVTCTSSDAQKISVLLRGREPGAESALAPGQRRTLAGLGHTIVRAKESAIVRVVEQEPFAVDRLIVPAEIREHFDLVGLQAKDRQEKRAVSIAAPFGPLRYYDPMSEGRVCMIPPRPVDPGDAIELEVRNVSPQSRAFYGALGGWF